MKAGKSWITASPVDHLIRQIFVHFVNNETWFPLGFIHFHVMDSVHFYGNLCDVWESIMYVVLNLNLCVMFQIKHTIC